MGKEAKRELIGPKQLVLAAAPLFALCSTKFYQTLVLEDVLVIIQTVKPKCLMEVSISMLWSFVFLH